MTEKANPSVNRTAEAFKTAGAIAYGGHGDNGWIAASGSPTEISVQDSGISEGSLNAFSETSTGSSFDVDIDGGEAFVFGSWIAIDTITTVTLSASTSSQTVYVGWNKGGSDDVIVGLAGAFDSASGNTDQKIPLYDFDTDSSGVTSVTDLRTIGQTFDGRFVNQTNSVSSDYTTDGEQLIFADTSGSALTVTLSTTDLDQGSNVIIVDSGGSAKSNNITIDTEGSATIDGSSSSTIESEYGAKAIASDGTNWYTSGSGGAGGVTVEEDDTISVDPATAINFSTALTVTDDGDGTVTIDGQQYTDEEAQDAVGTILGTLFNYDDAGDSITISIDDDEGLTFGTDNDVELRYDSGNDELRWQDETNTTDRMALDRTTGDLTISGQLTEGNTF